MGLEVRYSRVFLFAPHSIRTSQPLEGRSFTKFNPHFSSTARVRDASSG